MGDAGGNMDPGSASLGKGPAPRFDDGQPEIPDLDLDLDGGAGSGGGEISSTVSDAAAAMAAASAAATVAAASPVPPPTSVGPARASPPPADAAAFLAAGLADLSMQRRSAAPAPFLTVTTSSPTTVAATPAVLASFGSAAPAAGASFAGSSTPSSAQLAVLQQDNVNLLAQMSDLRAIVQHLQNSSATGMLSAASPAGGPVAMSGGGHGHPDADTERRAAKAEFESNAAAWRSGRVPWALRGQRGVDAYTKEMLGTVVAGLVTCTDKVVQQLKAMSGFNVLDFVPVGHSSEMSVADHFDLTCDAIMRVLKFGLNAAVPADAVSLARLQPLEAAMLQGRATFRMQLLMHHGEFSDAASRIILADLPNSDFRKYSNRLIAWMLPMCRLSTAPASFEPFNPLPVPEFVGIKSFSDSGSHLIRIFANRGGGGQVAAVVGKKRRADSSAPGGGEKRPAHGKICFSFRDTGACKFGDGCKFRHVRGARAQGARGSGGGSSSGGGGGAGGGGGGAASSALVVRGAGAGEP